MDRDNDGVVNFAEFAQMMMFTKDPRLGTKWFKIGKARPTTGRELTMQTKPLLVEALVEALKEKREFSVDSPKFLLRVYEFTLHEWEKIRIKGQSAGESSSSSTALLHPDDFLMVGNEYFQVARDDEKDAMNKLLQMAQLRSAFAVFDADGNGTLSQQECIKAFASLGGQSSAEEVRCMFDKVDTSGDERITFEECVGCTSNQFTGPSRHS